MSDINEARFSGAVENFKVIPTKTGTPMIRFLLVCGQEKLSAVAFKALADKTRLAEGERVTIRGRIQTTSWDDRDGMRRYGWQVIASEIGAEDVPPAQPAPPTRSPAPAQGKRVSLQPYQGGPF